MTSDIDPTILKVWLNRRLASVGGYVDDLYEDLRDGRNLILLLEVLFNQQISRELGRLRIHMLRNARVILNFLGFGEDDDAFGIREEDIVNGNQNQTRFLVTMIFQKFQMAEWNDESPLCKKNEFELPVNVEPDAVFDHGSNTVDKLVPSSAIGKLIEPEYLHYLGEKDDFTEANTRESIRQQRLELIPQPILPYEKTDGDVVPNWNLTAWSQPIMDVHVGDAKRMLIDAFVIYLARVVGNTTLHIGWETRRIAAESNDGTTNYHLVPMTVTVPLNEPWGSVSEVVDQELAILARNSEILFDQVAASDYGSSFSPVEPINSWRIVVSMAVGRDLEIENRPSKGTVLTLQVRENGEFRWIHDASYLDSDVIARITEHLGVLTSEYLVASSNEFPVCQLNMLSIEERNFLLTNLFTKDEIASKNVRLHDIFERRVIEKPKATALIHGDEKWTYEDLNTRANQLAHQLIDSGVVTECLVGICVSVSPAMLVGVLATLKAGGAYVPLDPVYPRRHLIEIITDTSVKIIIADENGSQKLGEDLTETMTIIDPNGPMLRSVANPVVNHLTSDNLACVICTSGTSGEPKQVMVEHRTITTFCDASKSSCQFDELDVWILFHSISFYVSLFEVWGALSHGGQLVLLSSDAARSAEATYEHICEHSVTVLHQMPSAFERLAAKFIEKSVPEHLRLVAFTGESFDPRILRPLFVSQGHALPRFVNIFGASEIPYQVTWKILDDQDTLRSSGVIGKCLPGVRVYLLDSHGSLVPFGAVGELHVGGACVARGYLNKPDLTNERFLADPYSEHPDARMYKTGDLARYLSNGNLVLVNRVGRRLELSGYSVKPEEIMRCLRSHPVVKDAFVCSVGNDVDKILVSYIVAEPIDDLAGILHRYVSLRLPARMVPNHFLRVDQFPLTLNGKLDIRALPVIDEMSFVRGTYEAPRTELEICIADIWKKELGLERVGRLDSYLILDAHSLLAVKVMESLREQGLAITASDLFRFPVLSDLARNLSVHTPFVVPPNVLAPGCGKLTPEMFPLIDLDQTDIDCIVSRVQGGMDNIQDIYALSPLQHSMMFHHLLGRATDPNLLINWKIFSNLAILQRYISALQEVIHRHDALRTAFFRKDLTTPAQVVLRKITLSVTEETLDTDMQLGFPKYCDNPYESSVDFQQAPLLRLMISRTSDDRWLLREVIHHLIIDRVTMEIIHTEINAICNEREESLPHPTPFRNFIARVRSSIRPEIHEEFFTNMLAEIDEPTLCYDLAVIHADVSSIAVSHSLISSEIDDQLRRQAEHLNTSLSTFCHLAWGVCVYRASRRENLVFGTVLSGRMTSQNGSNSQVGLYVNILPIQMTIDETPLNDFVRRTHEKLGQLMTHENASLMVAQRCSQIPQGAPLFNSLLNYRHHANHIETADMMPGISVTWTQTRTNYPLEVCVDDTLNGLAISAQTAEPVDSGRICAYMQRALESIIESLTRKPGKSINGIQIIPDSERQLILETWNTVDTSPSDSVCMHQLFEKQAILTPSTTVLIHENEKITYAELNERANCLANYLIELGVGPECLVGICVSSSIAMIVGLLAIHKAGGAYVPLDSSCPKQQLMHMIMDTELRLIIADDEGADQLKDQMSDLLVVINPNHRFGQATCNPIVRDLDQKHLACVMYTSGSTGQPKGVMVEHCSIVRLFETTEPLFRFSRNDVWCLVHSITFVLSMWEIWGALRYGGQLVIMSRELVRSTDATYELLCKHQVSVLAQTPSQFKMLEERLLTKPVRDHLRLITFAGESLDATYLRSFYDRRADPVPELCNMYGSTEVTDHVTFKMFHEAETLNSASLIGRHLPDTRLYVLDGNIQPVPFGMVGDLYVGGPRVARGYWNRPNLTTQRFLVDPFSDSIDANIYKTGDLAKFLPDGSLQYFGRDDQQVKIRGYRVETGEIEPILRQHPIVSDVHVIADGEMSQRRLIAYVLAQDIDELASKLHLFLIQRLPEYMIPSVYVRMDEFPITCNGKIDTKALPSPDKSSLVRGSFEAPRNEIEIYLAGVWQEHLGVENISRDDSYFTLGGNSLIAAQLIESLISHGLTITLSDSFRFPVLSDLAKSVRNYTPSVVPVNLITPDCQNLTPDMLPLVDLSQSDIDRIVSSIPGGLSNIQDVYGLSPLQEGILFHHLLSEESDPYVITMKVAFKTYDLLHRYIDAYRKVIDRHDILRTAIFWEELSVPVQVVHRRVHLSITEMITEMEDGSVQDDSTHACIEEQGKIDLNVAPLLRMVVSREREDRWILLCFIHHLIHDGETQTSMNAELQAFMDGHATNLASPHPFRNHIANVRHSTNQANHIEFFTQMLADIDEPIYTYGFAQLHVDSTQMNCAELGIGPILTDRILNLCRTLNVSSAALYHLSWSLVVSRTSGKMKAIFGTVLLGRTGAQGNSNIGVGIYVNTLPFRMNVDNTPVHICLRDAQVELSQLLEHQFASLASVQRCSGIAGNVPLFDSLLNVRDISSMVSSSQETFDFEVLHFKSRTNYPLTVLIGNSGSELVLQVQSTRPFDSLSICRYVQVAFLRLADALETTMQTPFSSIDILPETERSLLIDEWNDNLEWNHDPTCIHHLFERRVALAPSARALVYSDQQMTYGELNARANRLAHLLIKLGVTADCLVGLCVSISPAMLIGMLAILKAGGAYVPLDPTYPTQRLRDVIADARLHIIVADETGSHKLKDSLSHEKVIVDPNADVVQPDTNPLLHESNGRNLAYVIYTSGSTGRPKGVMVEHCNVTSLFDATDIVYRFCEQDIWSLTHSIAFDFSIWEIFGAFRHGGQLVLIPRETVRSADALYEQICQHRVSVFNQTASQFKIIIDKFTVIPVRDHVRCIIFGGESLEPQFLKVLYETRGDFMPLLCNMYGATETTVHSTFKKLQKADSLRSMCCIGERLLNTRTYVLDKNCRPVPIGVIGELYIGGPGVARGYLDRSELTRARFYMDSFSDCIDTEIYRTGDLVRVLPDKSLQFIGRDDHQVKIRGYRIELGEVEACLKSHELVCDARVLMVGNDIYKRLVAYVVANHRTDLEDTLRSYAGSQLPEFMVPIAIVIIDQIPLTHNGKIDLQALPSVERQDFSQKTYEAPRGEVELTLAIIWEELLNVKDVSRHDSFFTLGGNSLLAIRMIERMRRHGYLLTIADLYVHSTLSKVAITALENVSLGIPRNLIQSEITELTPEMLPLIDLTQTDIDCIVSQVPGGMDNIQDIYALSSLQDGILFHHVLNTGTDPYLLWSLRTVSNMSILEKYISAIRMIIDRHDVLRTAFFWENLSTPAQVVFRKASLTVTEITVDFESKLRLSTYDSVFQYQTLDLQKAPLLQFMTARRSGNSWDLVELLHHIIADHETLEIMNAEIYAVMVEQESTLPEPIPFRDFIAQIRSTHRSEAHQNFFAEMLTEIDESTLCYGLSVVHSDGSSVGESHRTLSCGINVQLRRQAAYLGVSPATLCHVAWGLVVSRTSQRDKPVFGTVLFGRMNASNATGHQMGLFINTLPIKLIIDNTPLIQCVRQTHERLGYILKHENASLLMVQRCGRVPQSSPLFNSILNYRHHVMRTRTNHMIPGVQSIRAHGRTNYPISCSVDDYSVSIKISSQTTKPVDSERVCAYMQQALYSIVENLAQEPEKRIISFQILPDSERKLLMETWNTVDVSAPDSVCLHQLFEKQAILTPTRTALIRRNERITYAELNTRANCLAHYLIELGVKPECLVGLCVSPSFEMIVGLLAIHKAGGAYVPLDPSYPEQRLLQIVEDTKLRIVITYEKVADQLRDQMVDTLIFINPSDRFGGATSNPIVCDLSQANLAYVIYTSGSTGQPKGVMVEHGNVVRLFETTEPLFHFSENDVWCLVHSISFDVSVWEIWGALRYGGQLVIMSREEVRSIDETDDLLCKHQVSVLTQTPSQFKVLKDRLLAKPVQHFLRRIILTGESLDAMCLRSFYDRRLHPVPQPCNMYGPTEVTVYATFKMIREADTLESTSLIGKHLPDTQLYVLDGNRHPAPFGVVGDLYIGGPRLARGYWNRPELTAERFIVDPFSDSIDGKIYRTGDLGRFLPDGSLEYIGRDDQQVKIRGFRIELGEVEACLRSHEAVRDARVLMIGDDIHKHLVAYVVANRQTGLEDTLRLFAGSQLPEYMVPLAIMIIDAIPLTYNGKIDPQQLPSFERQNLPQNIYEAPRGEVELLLAAIWEELLDVRPVSRHDSFFALGGHSLLAIRMIERMRRHGYRLTINDLYVHSTLCELAITALEDVPLTIPGNLIDSEISKLTPEMLPLIDLTQTDIDRIVSQVPGGIDNIHDIYGLSPLQDGILFHHVLNTGTDPYLLWSHKIVSDMSILERYISAMQIIIDRHDILRTAFFWENLSTPAQVVFRKASLTVAEKTLGLELELDVSTSDSVFQYQTLNLHEAPLLQFMTARRSDNSWDLGELLHHIIADHETLEIMNAEIHAVLVEQEKTLPEPIPFRNFIAQVRSTHRSESHQNFFAEMLTEIDEPTLCFDLSLVHSDGSSVAESHQTLSCELNVQLRRQATYLGVSPATLGHVAWRLVVSRTSYRDKPVFGTVLFGRMNVSNATGRQMGLFINTLPLKLMMDNTPLIECVRQTHETLGHLLEHENASLVMAQRCSQVPQGTPLFNSILNYRHNVISIRTNHTIPGIQMIRANERTNYPVTCSVDDDTVSIKISLQTAKPVDSERVCAYMQRTLESIVQGLTREPKESINSIKILPNCERQLLLETWNTVDVSAPDVICMHQLFEKHAILTPNRTALIRGDEKMTYAELNTRANCLAHYLIELGVEPECLVGLCVSPSFEMIVGLLAIHKAGGAYVALDLSFPKQRLLQMVRETRLRIIITDEEEADQLRDRIADTLIFIHPSERFGRATSNPIVRDLSQANLAYVIYTSGSTGQPKGVMVEHGNVVRLFETTKPLFHFSENDVWCLVHSISFDVSVWEIWGALRYGGQLVIMSREEVRSIDETDDLLCKHQVSVLIQTPSQFKVLKDRLLAKPVQHCLRRIILTGESLDAMCLRSFYDRRVDPVPQLCNMYGPTEVTVYATFKMIREADTLESTSLIGKHLPDTQLYVLDGNRHPAPFGVVGDLYIGGPRLARGYWNRPELTAERFIVDPFSDSIDGKIYRTGDLGRFLPDGSLEYIGRDDQQVKIRGYRIELGEVEACLRSHEAVSDARVLMIGDDIHKHLVAYVVANRQTGLEDTLRLFAGSQLPEYMVPLAIMIIDAIPLTYNGKIDPQQLPSFERQNLPQNIYEAPRGEVELLLAAIWEELLDVRPVSRHDSFFALGGHSLLAIRMIERMRRHGYRLTINDLYVHSTLCELAITALEDVPLTIPGNLIDSEISKLTPEMLPLIDLTQTDIDRIVSQVPGGIDNIQDIYALSPLQDGILFHYVLNTGTDPYLLWSHKTVSDMSILERYISAMQMIIDRHDVLRTAFFWENLSTPAQVVLRRASLTVTEKTLDSKPERNVSTYDGVFQYETLNLHVAPLLQFMTARKSDNSWHLVELLHHIIADHETLEIMNAEIYAVLVEQEKTLPEPIPFRNFIAQVRSTHRSESHQNFFAEMLTEIDEPTLCFDLSLVHSDGSSVAESHQTLSCELNVQLRRQATYLGVSPATLCHVAWGLVVSRTSHRDKPVFGTVLIGRMNVSNATGHQMGLFMNTLPIKLMINDTTLIECVRQTHERLGHMLKHENASLVMAQRCSRVPQGTPLFNSILNYRHNVIPSRANHLIPGIQVIRAYGRTNYPVTCSVDDDSDSFKISSQTVDLVDPERVCAYMQRALGLIVENFTRQPEKTINSIQILPDSERQLVSETWNTLAMSTPDSVCIHQLFEKQAIFMPNKTALMRDSDGMTYTELNTRANCLAHHLIELGVGPECLVGICVLPSFAMMVGLLAILKAGGAYVALDPSYPEQRLLQMVEDTELRIIIADGRVANQLNKNISDTLVLLDPNDRFDQDTSNPVVRDLSQANLAYVMYTSGSTGQPKGVMIEHGNVVRLFETTERLFQFSENHVWSLVHSIAFDLSVWEVWGALRYGGQLVIMSREKVRSIDETYDLLCKHQVSVLTQTPSQFKMLMDRLLSKPMRHFLRKIIFIGESLDPTCLRSFYERRADPVPQFCNMYGPTEVTVVATSRMLQEADTLESTSLIGKHLPDTSLYVLDGHRHMAPFGVVGELYVGGSRLARGYWNQPELTMKRFLVDPFSDSVDAYIYKTGDLARFLPDGSLEYIGRDDQQVKIRGYRVELGEVEACFRSHEAVRDARVLMIGDDIYKRLVAYVVANRQTDLEETLLSHAKRQLPEFMVPCAIIIIDEIPLTANGKLDRTALPISDSASVARTSYEAPKTQTEWKLATIWSQLLSIDEIGRDDNFFHVGGHSLLAMRMISLVAEQGLACTLNDLFRFPVLRDLASQIEMDSSIQGIYSAIPVRRTGSEPPLFFVPSGLGDYSYVFALSPHIQTCCPIYALPWPPSQEQPLSTMEEMARRMIPLIKSVQPQGPYRICGYSAGGVLCHAIASRLHESGDRVAFVGLIDTFLRETYGTTITQRRQLSTIGDLIVTAGLERIGDIVGLCRKIADMSFVEFIEAGKQLKLYASNLRSDIHARQLEQRVNFLEMVVSYVPKDLGIVIHQFNASELYKVNDHLTREIDSLGEIRRFDSAYSLPNTSFHIVPIPGDHATMVENADNRSVLGTAMSVAIDPRSLGTD